MSEYPMITLVQHFARHTQIRGQRMFASCSCGWTAEVTGSNKTALGLHEEHVVLTWRDARTVRTPEELDALPIGTVVQEQEYRHTWIRHSEMWHCSCDGTDVEWSSRAAFEELEGLPLIILWTPEDSTL